MKEKTEILLVKKNLTGHRKRHKGARCNNDMQIKNLCGVRLKAAEAYARGQRRGHRAEEGNNPGTD